MSNKKAGNDFEDQFAELAGSKGFWAHRMTANVDGQPADVIICKNNIPVLVDCKDCKNNVFKLSRIEENQELAMTKWLEKGNKYALFALKVSSEEYMIPYEKQGNKYAFFALKVSSEVYMIPYEKMISLRESGMKQLNYSKITEYGNSFDEWVVFFDADNSQ